MLSTVEEACLPVLTLHARTETGNVNSSQEVIEQVLEEVIPLKRIILGKKVLQRRVVMSLHLPAEHIALHIF